MVLSCEELFNSTEIIDHSNMFKPYLVGINFPGYKFLWISWFLTKFAKICTHKRAILENSIIFRQFGDFCSILMANP